MLCVAFGAAACAGGLPHAGDAGPGDSGASDGGARHDGAMGVDGAPGDAGDSGSTGDGAISPDSATGCTSGLTLCGGVCVDTTSSSANCGSCGYVCPVGAACTSSTCGGTCGGRMGLVCGATLGLDASTLYACAGGDATVSRHCTGTCITYTDGGDDACPCPSGNGAYCGATVSADTSTLYDCVSGRLSVSEHCATGCMVNPPGVADACMPCPSGNGLYCGVTLGADASTIYDCTNGVITPSQSCFGACVVNPPGIPDSCNACPSGNGLYCGSEVGADPNTLYDCSSGALTVSASCASTCHVSPPGIADYCEGTGMASCGAIQWWNRSITYGPYLLRNGCCTWWDTDLNVAAGTPIQLRHDSRLEQHPVEAWGWQPRFTDLVTGELFQFLHMQPGAQYTRSDGATYLAGTVVGLSGGNTSDTGYPTYSTGSHLCVETIAPWTAAFPPGTDACR